MARARPRARCAGTDVEVYFIERSTVLSIAQSFAETEERLKRRTRYLALQRSIVLIAKVSRSLVKHSEQPTAGGVAGGAAGASGAAARRVRGAGGEGGLGVGQRGMGACPVNRWQSARGLWRAHHNAERSFLRKHIAFRGSTEEGFRTGMVLGSELDQRVERSRETQLCQNLFAIATAARANNLASAPAAADLAASAPAAADVAASAPLRGQPGLRGGADNPVTTDCARERSPDPSGDGTSVLGASSYLRRKTASKQRRAAARSASAGKLGAAEVADEDDGFMDDAQPQKARPASRSRRTGGQEVLLARMDTIDASNEALRREVSQLTACLSRLVPSLDVRPSGGSEPGGARALEA